MALPNPVLYDFFITKYYVMLQSFSCHQPCFSPFLFLFPTHLSLYPFFLQESSHITAGPPTEHNKLWLLGLLWILYRQDKTKTSRQKKLDILRPSLKSDHASAIADHTKTTGHDIKWDHFDSLVSGKTDFHCKIKETLLIQELQPSFKF